jgi:hypothetical protein
MPPHWCSTYSFIAEKGKNPAGSPPYRRASSMSTSATSLVSPTGGTIGWRSVTYG